LVGEVDSSAHKSIITYLCSAIQWHHPSEKGSVPTSKRKKNIAADHADKARILSHFSSHPCSIRAHPWLVIFAPLLCPSVCRYNSEKPAGNRRGRRQLPPSTAGEDLLPRQVKLSVCPLCTFNIGGWDMLHKTTHIQLRNSTFYYRRRNKDHGETYFSLRTRSLTEAIRLKNRLMNSDTFR
jgi:hypothetical protein